MPEIPLQFNLNAKDEATPKIEDVKNAIKKTGEETQKVGKSMATSVFQGVMAWDLVKKAVGITTGFIKDSIKAWQSQEKADRMLAESLALVGSYSEETMKRFQNLASELQKITVYSDDEVQSAMTLAMSYGATTDEVEKLTKAALTLSTIKKVNLVTAVEMVTRAAHGQAQRLATLLGIQTEGKEEAEIYSEVMKVLGDRFNLVTAEAESLEGQQKRLRNAIGDVQEEIGHALLAAFQPLLDSIFKLGTTGIKTGNIIRDFGKLIYQTIYILKALIQTIGIIATTLIRAGDTFISFGKIGLSVAKDIWNSFSNLGYNLRKIFEAIKLAMTGRFKEAKEVVSGQFKSLFSETTATLNEFKNNQAGWNAYMADQFRKLSSTIVESFTTRGYDKAYDKTAEVQNKIVEKTGRFVEKTKEQTDKVADALSKLKDKYVSIGDKIKDTIRSITDEQEAFQKKMAEMTGEHEERMAELYAGHLERAEDIRKELEELEKDHNERITELSEREQDERTAEEIVRENEKYNERKLLLETKLKTEQEIIDKWADYRESAQKIRDLSDLDRQQQHYEKMVKQEEAQHKERMEKLEEKLTQEMLAYDTAYGKMLNKNKEWFDNLKAQYDRGFSDILATAQEKLSQIESIITQIESQMAKIGVTSKISKVGKMVGITEIESKQKGGKVSETGLYLLHEGEEVIPKEKVPAGGITINIIGTKVFNLDDVNKLAKIVGDSLIKQLQLNYRI